MTCCFGKSGWTVTELPPYQSPARDVAPTAAEAKLISTPKRPLLQAKVDDVQDDFKPHLEPRARVKRASWSPSGNFGAFVGRRYVARQDPYGWHDPNSNPAVCALYNVAERKVSHLIDLQPFNNFNEPLTNVYDAWSQVGDRYFFLTGARDRTAQHVVRMEAASGEVLSHPAACDVMELVPNRLGDKVVVASYQKPWGLLDFSVAPPLTHTLALSAHAEVASWSPGGEHLVALNIDGTSPFFYTIAGQKGPLRLAD